MILLSVRGFLFLVNVSVGNDCSSCGMQGLGQCAAHMAAAFIIIIIITVVAII